ncbi:MAG TPA: NAD(P)H-hydrate epimerase [Phycisphaerae bacterium]|jgi:NAD(P)H-hydrate epimerase
MTEFTFTRAALRQLDRRAVEDYHIPILVLMENAGRAVALAALNFHPQKILILAGPGNNGGDGMVAARHLFNSGLGVTLLLLAPRDSYKDAAAVQLAILDAMQIPAQILSPGLPELQHWLVNSAPGDLLIDALFGTGLSRPPEGLAAELIRAANASGHPILAVDIPSGIDCDSGLPLAPGTAIRATETVSFCGGKKGFSAAHAFTGKITIADIGAPRALLEQLAS